MAALLCVDVIDEGMGALNGTEGLIRERRLNRDRFREICPVSVLTGEQARPGVVVETLARASEERPITVLAYLGHGRPGVLYYRHRDGRELLSRHFAPADLEAAVSGRSVYLFACRTLSPEFAETLLRHGAHRAAGFSMSPAYSDMNGRRRLGNFDAYVIRALCREVSAAEILQFRDERVAVAAADRERHRSVRFRRSMDELMCALNSFHIHEREE